MRPKQHATTRSGDLFRARLEQIINMRHELVQLAGKIDWGWIDGEIAPLYSDQGRPGIETRFVIGQRDSLLSDTKAVSSVGSENTIGCFFEIERRP
jgi:IS5 family transposase